MCVVDLVPSSYPGTQTRLGGGLVLYVFTQYEADFMQESPSNSLGPIHIYLPQGRNFLEERVKMAALYHICTNRNR